MEILNNLKAILHSKRANIYYLEKCRVMQKDGRVLYLSEDKAENKYWNIPIANTTVILLGTGTSITQAAMRMLAQAGVLVGFSGGGATPLLMSTEIEWMTPQSEYRPTEYVQGWMRFWFNEHCRLDVAKHFQNCRLKFIQKTWSNNRDFSAYRFDAQNQALNELIIQTKNKVDHAENVTELLTIEAYLTKKLYKFAASNTKYGQFSRQHDAQDLANTFLNHGNYLAYGLAASTLWVLGIPHGFAVMHGKTRRGALIFDVADLIKDAVILPLAFICAHEKATEQEFRQQCLQAFTDYKCLDFMFNTVKDVALNTVHEDLPS